MLIITVIIQVRQWKTKICRRYLCGRHFSFLKGASFTHIANVASLLWAAIFGPVEELLLVRPRGTTGRNEVTHMLTDRGAQETLAVIFILLSSSSEARGCVEITGFNSLRKRSTKQRITFGRELSRNLSVTIGFFNSLLQSGLQVLHLVSWFGKYDSAPEIWTMVCMPSCQVSESLILGSDTVIKVTLWRS